MFRSLGKSKIALVLAILFGLSLFLMRGGERYSGLFGSDNVVASVSGTPISTSKFLRVMQMNVNQYSQMFGRPLTPEEIQTFTDSLFRDCTPLAQVISYKVQIL